MPNQHLLRRGRYSQINGIYHLTSATFKRHPTFTDHRLAMTACRCFTNPALNKTSELLCWVLMPDHVHWLVKIGEGDTVTAWVKRIKAVSSREVNRVRGQHSALWQPAFFDRALRQEDDLLTMARYIVANPLRAGLVRRVGDYPYWNAVWI